MSTPSETSQFLQIIGFAQIGDWSTARMWWATLPQDFRYCLQHLAQYIIVHPQRDQVLALESETVIAETRFGDLPLNTFMFQAIGYYVPHLG